MTKDEHFDTAVIGGGAAGIIAAIAASQNGARVVILEKNGTLGKKLLMTGNGRCNITQANYNTRDFIERLGKKGKFLFASLSSFGPGETKSFFENSGLKTKTEHDGRVFPTSDKAQDVLNVLAKTLKKNRVKIAFNQNVRGIKIKGTKVEYAELLNKKIYADNFILSTGGKAHPVTGSTGDGYSWLTHIGHRINPLAPALVPVKIKESWVKNLQGLSFKNIGINLIQNNRKVSGGSGKMLFTHFGLSGPVVINASKLIGEYLKRGEVFLEIDLFPATNISDLEKKLKTDFESYKQRNLKNYLAEMFPQKLALTVMEMIGIEKVRKIHSITKLERTCLARLMKGIRMTVEALLDFDHAVITSGGVNLKEVDPKTMRSKIVNNLFLAGEILDLDGPTGGYNLQIAWTTGHAAGIYANGKKKPVLFKK